MASGPRPGGSFQFLDGALEQDIDRILPSWREQAKRGRPPEDRSDWAQEDWRTRRSERPTRHLGHVGTTQGRTQARAEGTQRQRSPDTSSTTTYLCDTSDPNTARDDMCVYLGAAVFVEFGLGVADLALVNLCQPSGHIRVDHRSEKLLMERRVAEALLQAVTSDVSSLRVHMSLTELLFGRNVVVELRVECLGAVDLEGDHNENRRYGGDPKEGHDTKPETDS